MPKLLYFHSYIDKFEDRKGTGFIISVNPAWTYTDLREAIGKEVIGLGDDYKVKTFERPLLGNKYFHTITLLLEKKA